MPSASWTLRAAACLTGVALLATGCTAGPVAGPSVVHGNGGDGDSSSETTMPVLSVPKTDLNYSECGEKLAAAYRVAAPKDLKLECAAFDSPINPADPDSDPVSIEVVRARTSATPADAAPIVVTTGTDLPSSRLALTLGDGARALVDKNPVVLVDRRGIGRSSRIDCLSTQQRATIANDAAGDSRDADARATELSASTRVGADMCNDALSPNQLQYANADAAADLERLRTQWQVDRLALVGIGSGSTVALAYAGAHPGNVGRLIFDSPVGLNVAAPAAASARAAGVQNSLAVFARRCSDVGCALGPDALGTISRVVAAGASGSLPGLSDAAVLSAITTAIALGDTEPDGLKRLGEAIADADKGNTDALKALVAVAQPLRNSDGQILSRCNDLAGRPGIGEIGDLAKKWSADAPITATTEALGLARCDGWGVADPAAAPNQFTISPLILLGQNDPINGLKSAEQLAPMMVTAGADATMVSWDGLGYSVVAHSDCAALLVAEYLGKDRLTGPRERACPA